MLSSLRILLPALCAALPAVACAASLMDVYRLALQSDPLLREADANRLASLEARPQARAALLPQVSVTGFLRDQDSEGSSTDAFGTELVTTDVATDADLRQWQASLQQTVFRWDQWVALKQADKIIAQAEADYAVARQDLVIRVANTYFDVLAAEDTLSSTQAEKEAIAQQLEQSETRFEVGLIAITDVHEARAAYDNSVAAEIGAKRALATARESLREITGEYVESLHVPLEEMPLPEPDPANIEQWVSKALAENLSLESSRLAVEIARDNIDSQRAGHYPTVDLVLARSDFDNDGTRFSTGIDPFTGQPTTSGGEADSDSTTDTISLNFSVPLFSGGAVSSRVKEAVYQHRAARERLERVARETERQTRDSYLGVIAEQSRVGALKNSLFSSQTALEATEAGFEVGTRTTVDVLDARRDLFRAQTEYYRSRYDFILNILQLKQAAGSLSESDVAEIDSWLRPTPLTAP